MTIRIDSEGDAGMTLHLLEVLAFRWAGLLLFVAAGALVLRARRRQATPSNAPPPPPDAAWLVLMRDGMISDHVYLRADVDGVRVAILKSRRHAIVALRPGAHTLAVNAKVSIVRDSMMSFEAATGEIVVLRLKPPFLSRPFAERVTDVTAARATIAKLKSVTPNVTLPAARTDLTSS